MFEFLAFVIGGVTGLGVTDRWRGRELVERLMRTFCTFVFVAVFYLDVPPRLGYVTPIPGTAWYEGSAMVWVLSGALFGGYLLGLVLRGTIQRRT